MELDYLKNHFKKQVETSLFGRYIHMDHLHPLLKKWSAFGALDSIGKSVLNEAITTFTLGNGPIKILIWSQMHGNESTTTKAICDTINMLNSDSDYSKHILMQCTLKIIPILNPDGAKAYTRYNANAVDLNRDAQDLSQPESKALRACFNSFKPHFCFNMHGQRTIFSAGSKPLPATLSFLAPAQDKECTVTNTRKIAMALIAKMNSLLQLEIPGQVGIYDDAFNINCVGDSFQSLNVPTILFEAGHYINDYNREEARRLIFQALLIGIYAIANKDYNKEEVSEYLSIPQNKKMFYDIIIRNAKHENDLVDIAIQYEERLVNGTIKFIPKTEKMEVLNDFFGHKEVNARKQQIYNAKKEPLELGSYNEIIFMGNEKLSLKM